MFPVRREVPEHLPAVLELAVQYELGDLCAEAAQALLAGITAENVRGRAVALKRHGDHDRVKAAWADLVRMLTQDEELVAAAV